MELIKDNYNNPYYTCENCGSIFKVSEDDIIQNKYWECSLCHHKNYIESPDKLYVSYPEDFSHTSDAVDVPNDRINMWIKDSIAYLKNNPDEYMQYTISGNTLTLVTNDDDGDEFTVYVCKNFNYCLVMDGQPI